MIRRARIGFCQIPGFCRCIALLAVADNVLAGEIPGIPAQLPPFIERDVELTLSNDFLGRGAALDDYRTQQMMLSASIGDRWQLALDHSILTLHDDADRGRIDQLSASFGREFVDKVARHSADRLTAGVGLRATGDFYGERIQNGFHRIVDSMLELLPYTGTDRTDATLWLDAERYRQFGHQLHDRWVFAYWLRAASLLTSDGQWDNTLGAYLVARHDWLDLWVGARQDFRSGYARPVEAETAAEEQDLAAVFGVRVGPLIFETVQQFNNDASYGQLRLVSAGYRSGDRAIRNSRFALEAGFTVPDVLAQVRARFASAILVRESSRWRQSVVVDLRIGEPQYRDNPLLYVDTWQLGIGLDWERAGSQENDWLRFYAGVGVGWRNEFLREPDALGGDTSNNAGSAVLTSSAGLRVIAAEFADHWSLRLDAGMSITAAVDRARLDIEGDSYSVQDTTVSLFLGASFSRLD